MAAAEPAAGAGARVLHVNIDANLTDPQQVAMYAPDIYRHLRANEVRLQHCTRLPWLHPQSKEHAWGSSEPLCLPPLLPACLPFCPLLVCCAQLMT